MSQQHYLFSQFEREAVYRAIAERRDMRHFNDAPIDPETLKRLLTAAHQAPSVGLMQPWRMIRITRHDLKVRIHELVEQERRLTAKALKQRESEFMRLKVEGIMTCAELIVVCLSDQRDVHVFGRRTLPEMDLASVACAIQNLWLAARVENIGMGWVSIFDPAQLANVLALPEDASPVAILCLGHVDAFYPEPMLKTTQWADPVALEKVLFTDQWGNSTC